MIRVWKTAWSSHSFFPACLKLFLAAVLIFCSFEENKLGYIGNQSEREREKLFPNYC